MSKKRFVKLLMAQGYSRNEALNIARMSNALGKSYREAFAQVLFETAKVLANINALIFELLWNSLKESI